MSQVNDDDRVIRIEIREKSINVYHRHSIHDVALMVHHLADHFKRDEDLLIILQCAINLYKKNKADGTERNTPY